MEPAEQRRYLEAAQQLLLLCRDRVLAAGAAEDTGLFGAALLAQHLLVFVTYVAGSRHGAGRRRRCRHSWLPGIGIPSIGKVLVIITQRCGA